MNLIRRSCTFRHHRLRATVLAGTVILAMAAALLPEAAANAAKAGTATSIVGTPTKAMCPTGKKVYTVGYDVFSDSQQFAVARWQGMQHWEKTLGCIQFIRLDDNGSGATALENVRIFVSRKVNAVLLLQVVASAQAGLVDTLKAAHIPVLASDIPAPGVPFFSASDVAAGIEAGQALAAAYKQRHLTTLPYVVLLNPPAAGPDVARRMENARAVIAKAFPGMPSSHFLLVDIPQQTIAEAYTETRDAEPRIPANVPVLVTADNDDAALGAYEALSAAGKGDPLLVVGIGGLTDGLQATCRYPDWVGTVDYAPYAQAGYLTSELLLMLAGKPVPNTFYSPSQVVHKAQVKKLYPQDCKG